MIKKFFISTVIITCCAVVGFASYTYYQNDKVNRSKAETQRLSAEEATSIDTLEINPAPNPNPPAITNSESGTITSSSMFPILLRTGKWSGIGMYTTSGTAQIIQTENSIILQTGSDFNFKGAPDPVIYISSSANPIDISNAKLIGQLTQNTGNSAWNISQEDIDQYGSSVIIWCKAFDELLAVATFE